MHVSSIVRRDLQSRSRRSWSCTPLQSLSTGNASSTYKRVHRSCARAYRTHISLERSQLFRQPCNLLYCVSAGDLEHSNGELPVFSKVPRSECGYESIVLLIIRHPDSRPYVHVYWSVWPKFLPDFDGIRFGKRCKASGQYD